LHQLFTHVQIFLIAVSCCHYRVRNFKPRIFCACITVIFYTTCTDREVCSLVVMGNRYAMLFISVFHAPVECNSVGILQRRLMCNKKDGYRQRNVRQFLQAKGTIWLPQESLRHILASTGYGTGTIAVNVTGVKRGFNACQTYRSMCPSIFNRFPLIQPVSSKVRHFCIFWPPCVRPWDNRDKCYTVGKSIQCL